MTTIATLTVTTSDLLAGLQTIMPAIERRGTMPILGNVLFTPGETLTLTATDLDLGIRTTVPGTSEGKPFTLPAKRLRDYVRLLPDSKDLLIEVSDSYWAALSQHRRRTRIAGMSAESFPELPAVPDSVVTIGPVLSMIQRTEFAISREESRFTLDGALLEWTPESVSMVTTDGIRLAMATCDPAPGLAAGKILLPLNFTSEIRRLATGGQVSLGWDDNHLFAQVGNVTVTARRMAGTFPDYERVLPKWGNEAALVDRAELLGAIERVLPFSDERSGCITFSDREGDTVISSQVSEVGESEEVQSFEIGVPDLKVGFNGRYLVDFLKSVEDEKVGVLIRDNKSAMEMRAPGVRYVVMPMRVQ